MTNIDILSYWKFVERIDLGKNGVKNAKTIMYDLYKLNEIERFGRTHMHLCYELHKTLSNNAKLQNQRIKSKKDKLKKEFVADYKLASTIVAMGRSTYENICANIDAAWKIVQHNQDPYETLFPDFDPTI